MTSLLQVPINPTKPITPHQAARKRRRSAFLPDDVVLAPTTAPGRSLSSPAGVPIPMRGPRDDAIVFIPQFQLDARKRDAASCCLHASIVYCNCNPRTTGSSGPRTATATAPAGALPFTNGGTHVPGRPAAGCGSVWR